MLAGIDFDTYGVHVALLPLDPERTDALVSRVQTLKLREQKQSGEDFGFYALQRMSSVLHPIDWRLVHVAYIERGYGASRRSDFTMGAVFGALHACLPHEEIDVNRIGLGEWRKMLTGNGNAKTDAAREALADLGVRIDRHGARFNPTSPAVTKDEIDATAIAWAGRELNARAFA